MNTRFTYPVNGSVFALIAHRSPSGEVSIHHAGRFVMHVIGSMSQWADDDREAALIALDYVRIKIGAQGLFDALTTGAVIDHASL